MAVLVSSDVLRSLWKQSKVPSLDGIRAISCVWVSFSHAFFLWQMSAMSVPGTFQLFFTSWWPVAVPMNGDLGVDFFLLLSGYLIGSSVFEEIRQDASFNWVPFLIRRVFRIAPVFYMAVFLAIATQGFAACRLAFWKKLMFIENMTVNLQEEGQCAPQSWSVGLEMQLYLVTPLLMMLALRLRRQCEFAWVVIGICGCVWVACCVARHSALLAVVAMNGSVWYTGTQYRCAPYVIGVAVSVLCHGTSSRESTPLLSLPGVFQRMFALASWAFLADCAYFGGGGPLLGFESPMPRWPFGRQAAKLHFVLGRPLVGAAAGYLLWRSLSGHEPCLNKVLSWPVWRPLARLSYSAYMLQVVSFAVAPWLLAPLADATSKPAKTLASLSQPAVAGICYAWAVLYTLFAFALALVSYAAVEVPGISLGQRLARKLSQPKSVIADLQQPLVT
ncbi:nrf-6 [Symbiodinium sp. CCMP2592]|nr:nrf-6 [Symbiodinium sp. CCMP2592]